MRHPSKIDEEKTSNTLDMAITGQQLRTVHNFTISVSVEILLPRNMYGSNQCNFTVNKQIFDAVQIFIKKNPKDYINNSIILICNCI